MIGKELLSEVLGCDCSECYFEDTYNLINYKYQYDVTWSEEIQYDNSSINIHELAHKCKEWAKLKELTLFSGAVENSDNEFDLEWSYDCQIFSHKEGIELFYIKCESEPEAIFKACQWILENK